MRKNRNKFRGLILITIAALICGGSIWFFIPDDAEKHNTIILSDVTAEVTMPSEKVVVTNEWFTRDPEVDLALLAIDGNSDGPFYLIENLKFESKATITDNGGKLRLLIDSLESSSNGKEPHRLHYVVSSTTFDAEPVGAGQPM